MQHFWHTFINFFLEKYELPGKITKSIKLNAASLNELSLNVNKTVFMALEIYSNSVPNNLKFLIENKKIERVYSAKYLGIIIDSNMKCDKHILRILLQERDTYSLFLIN